MRKVVDYRDISAREKYRNVEESEREIKIGRYR